MYFTLLVVVILTAIALVAVALGIARAISPFIQSHKKERLTNVVSHTRGQSWMQFKVGYYCLPFYFDVRCRNGIFVPVGGSCTRFRSVRIS